MRAERIRGDSGTATTEFVLAAPAFLFLIMLIMQAGLYFHAVAIASAAAQDGARAASLQGATNADGVAEARDLVETLAPRLLTGVGYTPERDAGNQLVRMTVTGNVVEVFVIPGTSLDLSVRETAESPVERFRPATESPPDAT
jgi:Flp pilus assembly protein TadG